MTKDCFKGLTRNGYQVLRGKQLRSFLDAAKLFGKDINVLTKATVPGILNSRAFLNIAMLLSKNERVLSRKEVEATQ